MNQMELFSDRGRKSLPEKVEIMKNFLHGSGIAIPVENFTRIYGWSDRVCRAVVNESQGEIIATESGYILTRNATPDQFREANGRIYAQARQMMRRALKERSVRHKMIGRKP